MIQLVMNGLQRSIDPSSIEQLRHLISQVTPEGEVPCVVKVNGMEVSMDRVSEFDVESIRSIDVQTGNPATLARNSLPETQEWIGRICGVLASIAEDYRFGREREAASRLVGMVDALQVLVGLLGSIHSCLELGVAERASLDSTWKLAEEDLKSAISALVGDLEAGDPIRLADRAAHALPRSLDRFREILSEIPA